MRRTVDTVLAGCALLLAVALLGQWMGFHPGRLLLETVPGLTVAAYAAWRFRSRPVVILDLGAAREARAEGQRVLIQQQLEAIQEATQRLEDAHHRQGENLRALEALAGEAHPLLLEARHRKREEGAA